MGRHPTGKLRIQIKLSPKARTALNIKAKRAKMNRSEYIERLILR